MKTKQYDGRGERAVAIEDRGLQQAMTADAAPTPTKVGCVNHDCESCMNVLIKIADLKTELAAKTAECARLRELLQESLAFVRFAERQGDEEAPKLDARIEAALTRKDYK